MTILTGSLTSLQLSGSALVQRKNTGAEVLMDLDFTQLPTQTLTNNQFNSIGNISMKVTTTSSPFFKIVNGEGLSYSNTSTGNGYINIFYYTAFTGSTVNVADRIRVVAEFSGTRADAAASTDPDYFALNITGVPNQMLLTCRGPDSDNGNKFSYVAQFTTENFGPGSTNPRAITTTGATTSVSGTIRLDLDYLQGNAFTGADRVSSPAGLTDFPAPGEVTPQGRMRMYSNTSQPQLIGNYTSPFTSSADSHIQVGFDQNQAGTFSGSLQRLTIFRYGAD